MEEAVEYLARNLDRICAKKKEKRDASLSPRLPRRNPAPQIENAAWATACRGRENAGRLLAGLCAGCRASCKPAAGPPGRLQFASESPSISTTRHIRFVS